MCLQRREQPWSLLEAIYPSCKNHLEFQSGGNNGGTRVVRYSSSKQWKAKSKLIKFWEKFTTKLDAHRVKKIQYFKHEIRICESQLCHPMIRVAKVNRLTVEVKLMFPEQIVYSLQMTTSGIRISPRIVIQVLTINPKQVLPTTWMKL